MKKVLLVGLLCMGSHLVFGMERKRDRQEEVEEDTGTKKAHTDDAQQVRMLVIKSLDDEAEDIKSLLKKINEELKKDLNQIDLEDVALEDIANNLNVQEWQRFLSQKIGLTELHMAAARNKVEEIGCLLDRGGFIEDLDKNGRTPLHWAALQGRVEAIELLLDRGAVIEAQANDGSTPLHRAAFYDQVGAIGLLLDRGASIEAQANYGWTPLYGAAFYGEVGAIGLLLDRGAEIEAQIEDGSTSLHAAADEGCVGAIELLLGRGAKIEAQDKDGRTALHCAAERGQVGAIGLLLDRGAKIEARDKHGRTPLHWAALNGQVGAIGCLLDRGAVIEAQTKNGNTPLHVASSGGQVGAIGCLLDRGAKVDARVHTETPLMLLARENHFEAVREFISHVCLIPESESHEFVTKARKNLTGFMWVFKKYVKQTRMPKDLWLRIMSSVKDLEENNILLPLLVEVFRKRGYRDIPLTLREVLGEHLIRYTLEGLPSLMAEAQGVATHDGTRALLDPASVLNYGSALLKNIRKRCGC